jgi:hypothetical protein
VEVFGHAREPDFSRAPGWLDRENNDDRILASAWEVQGVRAAATVVLITGDLNLQTKADNVGLPYVETPKVDGGRPTRRKPGRSRLARGIPGGPPS